MVNAGPGNPRGLLDKLVGACLSLLIGAIALYAAVKLVAAIWSTLLVILGGTLLVGVLVAVWRRRNRDW